MMLSKTTIRHRESSKLVMQGALEVAASFCVVLLNTINEPRFDAKSSDNAVSAVVASRIGQVAYLVVRGLTQVVLFPCDDPDHPLD
jgi:hypothetical protein